MTPGKEERERLKTLANIPLVQGRVDKRGTAVVHGRVISKEWIPDILSLLLRDKRRIGSIEKNGKRG